MTRDPGSLVRIGTDLPPVPVTTPCGEFTGEVLVDSTGRYVGDMTGPSKDASIQSGFTSGMAQAYGYATPPDGGENGPCCGGLLWIYSPFWIPPWLTEECFGVDNYVPVHVASGWTGVLYPETVVDAQNPPQLAGAKSYHFTGSGSGNACIAFAQPVITDDPFMPFFDFSFWYPEPGSQWVWEGWVRCDGGMGPEDDVSGSVLKVGWATVDWGFRVPETACTVTTTWTHFRTVFEVTAPWGSTVAAGPQLPALQIRGPKMLNSTTHTKHYSFGGIDPSSGDPIPPGCYPSPTNENGVKTHEITSTKYEEKGGFYLMCLHLYPLEEGQQTGITINRRFGLGV